ncbi:MAG: hypothetical protein HKO06_04210 [Pseudomonadales bacterium]|nr:hypothetical protein [Pseudomonadales bacterium]
MPKVPNQGLLPDQKRGLGWWLQWVLLFVSLSAMVIGATVLLRKRHEQRRHAYVDAWENNPLRSDEHFSDNELAEMVKLKGEALPDADDSDQLAFVDEGEGAAELQASLYIAYERYDEAESLLCNALREQPGNHALQSQLMEVYSALGKTEAYQKLAKEIAEANPPLIDDRVDDRAG